MKFGRVVQKAARIGRATTHGSANVSAVVVANVGERGTTRARASRRQHLVQRRDPSDITQARARGGE